LLCRRWHHLNRTSLAVHSADHFGFRASTTDETRPFGSSPMTAGDNTRPPRKIRYKFRRPRNGLAISLIGLGRPMTRPRRFAIQLAMQQPVRLSPATRFRPEINSMGQKLANLYPLPNINCTMPCNNYLAQVLDTITTDNETFRVDENLGD